MQVKASLSCLAAVLLMAGCNGGSGTLSETDEMVDVPVMVGPDSPDDGDMTDDDTGDTPDEDLPQIGDLPGGPSSPGGDSTTQRQPVVASSFGAFGAWNRDVAALIDSLDCGTGPDCEFSDRLILPPEDSTELMNWMTELKAANPYGMTAQFDPNNASDQWAASWRGPYRGAQKHDPDHFTVGNDGPATPEFAGWMILEIKSPWTTVILTPDDVRFLTEDGERTIPIASTPWTAELKTDPGLKGYFEGETVYSGPRGKKENTTTIWGQFNKPASGNIPTAVIGHIQDRHYIGTFTATTYEPEE